MSKKGKSLYRCLWEIKSKACNRQKLGLEEVHYLYQGDLQNFMEGNLLEGLGSSLDFQV